MLHTLLIIMVIISSLSIVIVIINNKFQLTIIKIDKAEEVNKKIKTLFNTDSDTEEYITYQIYIIRDGDTVDSIIAKYDIDVESLKEYNDISDLKIGDKIIIPRS